MRALLLVGLLLLANQAFGQFQSQPINPKTYSSSSGRYKLWVNPDNREASTGGTYQESIDGKVIWKKHFPFALRNAGVTDEGRFGGFAERANGSEPPESVIVIGANDGTIELSEIQKNRGSQIVDSGPERTLGLIFDAAHDRMTIRRPDPRKPVNYDNCAEQWRTYRLSDAKPGELLTPGASMKEASARVIDARSVPGTPLTLISWYAAQDKPGAIVTLVDVNAKPVWQMNLKGDYDVGQDEFEKARNLIALLGSGSILGLSEKQFEIRHVKARQRVSYRIEPEDKNWKVKEISTSAFSIPSVKPNKPLIETHLKLSRKWKVPLAKLPNSPIYDIVGFVLAGRNHVATLRGGDSPSLVYSNLDGAEAITIPLRMLKPGQGAADDRIAWMGSRQFVVTHYSGASPKTSKAWLVDVSTKHVKLFTDFGTRCVSAISHTMGGGIAVVATVDEPNTMSSTLAVYTKTGRLSWEKTDREGYGGKSHELLSPIDISVDSRGRLVVLDLILHCIKLFSSVGTYLETKPLPKAATSYPDHISCVKDGYLVWDYAVYLLDSHCRVVRKMAPHFKNSLGLENRCTPQMDSEGKVWLSDENALYRLDRSSTVDRTLGRIGGLTALKEICYLLVKQDGSVLARDKTSNEVHIFNSNGVRSTILRPINSALSYSNMPIGSEVKVDDLGRVYVDYPKGFVRYSASGRRESPIELQYEGGRELPSKWTPGCWWNGACLVDGSGKAVTTLTRLPNEDWLNASLDEPAVSPSGSLAFVSSNGYDGLPEVGFYGPTGIPETTATVPIDLDRTAHFAYDGRNFYFTQNNNVLCFNKQGKGQWKFALPARKGADWNIFSSRGGLALFDGVDTVYWYATPK